MTGRATAELPRVDQLSPRQQTAIDCARCARRLGAAGRVWGEVRHRGRSFRLWICETCAHHTPLVVPLEPPPGAGDQAPGTGR